MTTPTVPAPSYLFKVQRAGEPCTVFDNKVVCWRQKTPYNLVLPYERRVGTYTQTPARFDGGYPAESGVDASTLYNVYYQSSGMARANNDSYEKFKNKVYDTASLGVDFAEYRQTVGSMERVLGTLAKFTRQVRGKHFVDAAKTLKMYFVPPGVSARKAWANNWLEYHFGWEPLVRDVYDSIAVISNPLKTFSKATGWGQSSLSGSVVTDSVDWKKTENWLVLYDTHQGGTVRSIDSPLLHSLDQFGVINPLALSWEVVPFSFVVDWFVNVGQVLSSLSDFAGMTLDSTFTTYIARTQSWGNVTVKPGHLPGVNNLVWGGSGVWARRNIGLTLPVFSVKKIHLPSKTRAATALSLLIQQMRGK